MKKLAAELPDAALKEAVRSLTILKNAVPTKEVTRDQKVTKAVNGAAPSPLPSKRLPKARRAARLRELVAIADEELAAGRMVSVNELKRKYRA